jgi:hypothetical protein
MRFVERYIASEVRGQSGQTMIFFFRPSPAGPGVTAAALSTRNFTKNERRRDFLP